MRKAILIAGLYTLFGATPLQASFNYLPVDPKGTAMSGALTALPGNAWGIFCNPASPATRSRTTAGIA